MLTDEPKRCLAGQVRQQPGASPCIVGLSYWMKTHLNWYSFTPSPVSMWVFLHFSSSRASYFHNEEGDVAQSEVSKLARGRHVSGEVVGDDSIISSALLDFMKIYIR